VFERSLVASQVKHASAEERWTALISITVQVGLAAGVIASPLLHPERLVSRIEAPSVVLPLVKMPKVEVVKAERAASNAPALANAAPVASAPPTAPTVIPTGIDAGDPLPMRITNLGDMGSGLPDALGKTTDTDRRVVPEVKRSEPVRISAGVSAGRLLMPIRPVYPPIAKAAGVQGAVVVDAVISTRGQVECLRVVSGPEMLTRAAMEAIQLARYEPFRLNGEPTEVETTITVNFRLGP
jgi:protein TonB